MEVKLATVKYISEHDVNDCWLACGVMAIQTYWQGYSMEDALAVINKTAKALNILDTAEASLSDLCRALRLALNDTVRGVSYPELLKSPDDVEGVLRDNGLIFVNTGDHPAIVAGVNDGGYLYGDPRPLSPQSDFVWVPHKTLADLADARMDVWYLRR